MIGSALLGYRGLGASLLAQPRGAGHMVAGDMNDVFANAILTFLG